MDEKLNLFTDKMKNIYVKFEYLEKAKEELENLISLLEIDKKEVKDTEEIKDIIYVLSGSGKGRTTKEESIQDYPVNAENIIKIEFDFKEGGQSLLYVYKKSEKMYIEVPYNGIYRINGDEYNSMEKYTRIN